jgi:hypothetical protein
MLEAAFRKPPATLKIVTVSRLWRVFSYWFWSGLLKAASSILKRVTEACSVAISGLTVTFQENPEAAIDILKRLTVKSLDLVKSFHSSKKIFLILTATQQDRKKNQERSAHIQKVLL